MLVSCSPQEGEHALLDRHSFNSLYQYSNSVLRFSTNHSSTCTTACTPQQDEPLQQQQQHPHAAKSKIKVQWKGTVWTPAAPAAVTEPLQEQALLPAEPDDPLLSDSAHTTNNATAGAGIGVGSGNGQHRGYDTHSGKHGYDTHDTHDAPYSEHSHHSEQRSARGSSFGNRSEAHDEGNKLVQLLALNAVCTLSSLIHITLPTIAFKYYLISSGSTAAVLLQCLARAV
jgi:hypothetical protein